jgi:hypothetical protein
VRLPQLTARQTFPDQREQNPFHADVDLEIMSVRASNVTSSVACDYSPDGTELD